MSAPGRGAARYAALFARLSAAEEGAFVPFLTLGDPTPERSLEAIEALVKGGADALELGIPFSDPVADGPTIQASALRALEAGTTPSRCFELLSELRARHPALPIGLLVYANLVAGPGLEAFYARAAAAGVDSVLVADVPTFEVEPFLAAAAQAEVAPVLIAPPNLDAARLEQIARWSAGYTYVVTRAGVTGARDTLSLANASLAERLKAAGAAPPIYGFGISQPEHVQAALAAGAAGAISGSALVRKIEAHLRGELTWPECLSALEGLVRRLKAASRSA